MNGQPDSFVRFWQHVNEGKLPCALPFTIEGEEGTGLVEAPLVASPQMAERLTHFDPVVRTRAIIESVSAAAHIIQKHYPHMEIQT